MYCDISVELASLSHMMKTATDWDAKYNALKVEVKPDGKKLSDYLKEAQLLSVRTPTMMAALLEMKQSKEWMELAQRFFNSNKRKTQFLRQLDEAIGDVVELAESIPQVP